MEENMTLNDGACRLNKKGWQRNSALKLSVVDWMCDLPETIDRTDYVEVQFKNTRKGYYINDQHLPLQKGDMVAVEAQPGHDIGEVTLVGKLVLHQMRKNNVDLQRLDNRKVYCIARENDMEKYAEAKSKEQATMIRARQLAESLHLSMKIGDVEYQGDGTKAIFYYIADGRVDFRQLIKVYAESFRVRIEMKQIGARQEAGRIGGTGPCGRELCCSTWMTQFNSVGTNAARLQNIALNPQKLAGQCAKLKCCLNYETPIYEEAVKKLPARHQHLETKDAVYYYFSADALKEEVTYSTDSHHPANLQTISVKRAREIIDMNRRGEKPLSLGGKQSSVETVTVDYQNVVGQDDLTRFDKKKRESNNHHNRSNSSRNRNRNNRNRS